jgi:hypothetical protein
MATTKKPKVATKTKAAKAVPNRSGRRMKRPEFKRFRYTQRIKYPAPKLPSSYDIFKGSLKTLWRHKSFFIILTIVYGLLSLVLVKGLSNNLNLPALKNILQNIRGGSAPLGDSVTLFRLLVRNIGNTNNAAGAAYQSILLIMMSLVIIWGLRQAQSLKGKKKIARADRIKVKQAFYQGMYPMVPFVFILVLIGIQLVPLLLGGTVYSTVTNNGLAIHPVEKISWALLFFAAAITSFYLLTSSLFALYIVTLPDMKPYKAWRTATKLVRFRRWTVMRKILFLPVSLLLFIGLLMLPLLIWATPVAQWTFFALSLLSLSFIHSYMYNLYRSLL